MRILAFIDLVQDIEVMAPLLLGGLADRHRGWSLDLNVSRSLRASAPDALARLKATGLPFRLVVRREVIAGRSPDLRGVGAVITASESSHPAHAAGHALARRANAAGLATYTLQHGLENVGLDGRAESIASRRIFTWFPPARATAMPAEVRSRLVHVGRPHPPAPGAEPRCQVGVFENLHAERYGAGHREAFVAGLDALAGAGVRALLRPHPAGGWSRDIDLGRWPTVTLAGAGTIQEAIAACARVITTPSTVALDAAQAGRPVALAGDGGELYAPLPVLREPDDWPAFALALDDQSQALTAFLERVVQPGDAVVKILDRLRQDLMNGLASQQKV
jgi:hypothetical protein